MDDPYVCLAKGQTCLEESTRSSNQHRVSSPPNGREVPGVGFGYNMSMDGATINPHETALMDGDQRIYWDGTNIFYRAKVDCGPLSVVTPNNTQGRGVIATLAAIANGFHQIGPSNAKTTLDDQ